MARRKNNNIRVGMTGSDTFDSKITIKEAIFKLKQSFGNSLEIISRGSNNGADKWIKKFSLEMGVIYGEFNPSHTAKNLYSKMHEGFYGKNYSARNFFIRDAAMVKYIDYLVVFQTAEDKNVDNLIGNTQKQNKKVVVL